MPSQMPVKKLIAIPDTWTRNSVNFIRKDSPLGPVIDIAVASDDPDLPEPLYVAALSENGGYMYGPISSLREKKVDVPVDNVLPLYEGNYFVKNVVDENVTFSLDLMTVTDELFCFFLELNGAANHSITFWDNISWIGGIPATFSTGKDIVGFWSYDNTNWFGKVIGLNFLPATGPV